MIEDGGLMDSKFLDEERIIHRADRDVGDSSAETSVEVTLEEPPEEELPSARPAKPPQRRSAKAVDPSGESRRVAILRELIDKAEHQAVAKQVDIRVYQRMFNNASSNEERRRCEETFQRASADLETVRMKLRVMNDLLEEWRTS